MGADSDDTDNDEDYESNIWYQQARHGKPPPEENPAATGAINMAPVPALGNPDKQEDEDSEASDADEKAPADADREEDTENDESATDVNSEVTDTDEPETKDSGTPQANEGDVWYLRAKHDKPSENTPDEPSEANAKDTAPAPDTDN